MRPLDLEPVPTLLKRVRAELSADFGADGAGGAGAKPLRVSRAPGRLDVMGGIADYTGSLVCELPLDRAAAVALCTRDDRDCQVFSFNLHDDHKPFTFRIPLVALATQSLEDLRREFNEPGRKWAGYLAGCLFILHEQGFVDLRNPKHAGINIALLSTVPLGVGVSSSAAIEVATMMNLVDHFAIRDRLDPMQVAVLCQQVENRVVGAPCGIMDQVTSCAGEADALLRMVCQPHQLLAPLKLPEGVRVVGINSGVRHSVGGGLYARTRYSAFMAHKIILETMRRAGQSAGRELEGDPMNGYLANLDPADYKQHFRPRLPEFMSGADFLRVYRSTIDAATTVQPDELYPVQHAADHHVLEAQRVIHFVEYLEEAASNPEKRNTALNRAGHLMYASHLSYTNDAMLGADECDLLVNLVRARESAGLYGAKITGGGSGGTVALLATSTARADGAIAKIMSDYEAQTGNMPELFDGTSPGAWEAGSMIVR
ncbi:MAG: galactokinase [Phycisphaerales bacterium]|jgi:L-arabinokinase|nr:galactokinase [Phycisphaerales bacterium]